MAHQSMSGPNTIANVRSWYCFLALSLGWDSMFRSINARKMTGFGQISKQPRFERHRLWLGKVVNWSLRKVERDPNEKLLTKTSQVLRCRTLGKSDRIFPWNPWNRALTVSMELVFIDLMWSYPALFPTLSEKTKFFTLRRNVLSILSRSLFCFRHTRCIIVFLPSYFPVSNIGFFINDLLAIEDLKTLASWVH